VVATFRRRRGFANRPRALRRSLLDILKRRDRLTAFDLAGIVYGQTIIVRPGHFRRVTPAQLSATRRALRVLVRKGRIEVLYRYRRWKVFVLRQDVER
jgi:hypothetical protein